MKNSSQHALNVMYNVVAFFFFSSFYNIIMDSLWNIGRIAFTHTHTHTGHYAIIDIIQHHKRRTITKHHQIHSGNNLKKKKNRTQQTQTHTHSPIRALAKQCNARQAGRQTDMALCISKDVYERYTYIFSWPIIETKMPQNNNLETRHITRPDTQNDYNNGKWSVDATFNNKT